ncbi:hypothetical protein HU200_058487 [Digitaria exilis]|uniref:Uncharacterized protein n=1 Tax=Digitaria exilis TaxID=1010633 RepID=A0A835E3E9_9POAL|nr:hypothetical protein HU200_058487 [Digitaria exilis]
MTSRSQYGQAATTAPLSFCENTLFSRCRHYKRSCEGSREMEGGTRKAAAAANQCVVNFIGYPAGVGPSTGHMIAWSPCVHAICGRVQGLDAHTGHVSTPPRSAPAVPHVPTPSTALSKIPILPLPSRSKATTRLRGYPHAVIPTCGTRAAGPATHGATGSATYHCVPGPTPRRRHGGSHQSPHLLYIRPGSAPFEALSRSVERERHRRSPEMAVASGAAGVGEVVALAGGVLVRLVLGWLLGLGLKSSHHHHHGAVMEGKPPPPLPSTMQQPAATPRVSMFRRLLVKVSASEKFVADGKEKDKDDKSQPPASGEADAAGSVGLDRMVLSFMEEAATVERPPRSRCNCFNGSNQEESDDEDLDFFLPSEHTAKPATAGAGDALESLKGLVQSASVAERNLLADASRIADKCGKNCKGKAECRRVVADGLRALGYDAAVCTYLTPVRSVESKPLLYPCPSVRPALTAAAKSICAGEHEYIDAVVGKEEVRLIVEVDFRSQFELARSTKAYRAALQALPAMFVGTPDRLGQIVAVVGEAARQSLKKKGLHFPPWRKPEYMRAKWLSPHVRCGDGEKAVVPGPAAAAATPVQAASFSGAFELVFDRKPNNAAAAAVEGGGSVGEKITVVVSPWRPTEEASKMQQQQVPKAKVVTGLAAVL